MAIWQGMAAQHEWNGMDGWAPGNLAYWNTSSLNGLAYRKINCLRKWWKHTGDRTA
jgi:hypothetical protein